jgi:hypothetical protein
MRGVSVFGVQILECTFRSDGRLDATGAANKRIEDAHNAEKDDAEGADHDEDGTVGRHDILLAALIDAGGASDEGEGVHGRERGG